MTYGSWLDYASYEEYYRDRLSEADNQLYNYPSLKEVFNDLSFPKDEKIRKNPLVLRLAKIDRGEGGEPLIQLIDKTLRDLSNRLSKNDLHHLQQELRSDDRRVVVSRLTELISYNHFSTQGLSVTPEPDLTGGGKADLRINDKYPVYIEITRLGTADLELSIETLFESVAQDLVGKISPDTLLHIIVDTGRLKWDSSKKGALQKQASSKRLLDQFDSAHLALFLDRHKAITLRDLQNLRGSWTIQYLIDNDMLHVINQYSDLGSKIKQNMNDPSFQPVLKSPLMDFDGPIISAFTGSCNGKLVEIHAERVFPSNVAGEQKRVFLGRVEKNVEDKIRRGQREPGEPNLLFISATHWLAHGYSRNNGQPLADAMKQEIQQRIETVLEREQPSDLVGVVLTEDDPARHVLVDNPYTDKTIQSKFDATKTNTLIS